MSLRYPLYSLASRWGAASTSSTRTRRRAASGATASGWWTWRGRRDVGRFPTSTGGTSLTVDASVVRSFGSAVIQRVTAGYLVDRRSSDVLPDFPGDALTAQQFLRPVGADHRAALGAVPALRDVHAALRRAARSRHLRPAREPALGPSLRALRVGQGLPALGADLRALGLAAAAGYAVAPAGGYMSLSASASARRLQDDGRWIDQVGNATVYAATPARRPVVPDRRRGGRSIRSGPTRRTRRSCWAARTGCAAMRSASSWGRRRCVGHIEIRTVPLGDLSRSASAALLFYDVGDAAPSFADLVPAQRRRARRCAG